MLGDDRHAFRALMTEPISIAIVGSDLFWTNKNSRRVYWADKHNTELSFNKKITLDVSDTVEAMHLAAVTGVRIENHPCLVNNGDCSHLCLQSLKETICTCPLGQVLTSDNKTCFAPKHCTPDEYKCEQTDICVPKELLCDGKKDCLKGDDETECVKERRCKLGLFECMNGECIAEKKVCDLHFDCRDKSDELNCDGADQVAVTFCPPGNFKCKDRACISDRLVCDNIQDCNDGSDEDNCKSLSCNSYEFR